MKVFFLKNAKIFLQFEKRKIFSFKRNISRIEEMRVRNIFLVWHM